MRLHVESTSVQISKLGAVVPCCQLEDVLHEGFDAQLGSFAGRAVDIHRLQAAIGLPKVVVDDQVGDVVDVVVGDEEFVSLVVGHLHMVEGRVGARARVEDKYLTVAQLSHKPGAGLAFSGWIARPQGRNAHLILGQRFNPCNLEVRVLLEFGMRILYHNPLSGKWFGSVRFR